MGRWVVSVVMAASVLVTSAHAAMVPIEVKNPRGVAGSGWPLTCGVPFPAGALKSPDSARLLSAGREVPAQVTLTGRYPDRSVRWLLLDWQADVPAGGGTWQLEYGEGVRRAAVPKPLQVDDGAEAVKVDTGAARLTVSKRRGNGLDAVRVGGQELLQGADGGPYFVDDGGAVYRGAADTKPEVTVELAGPLRTVVTARGWYVNPAGERKCRFITRVHAYAGKPWVRVFTTWLMTEDSRALRFADIGFRVPLRVDRATYGVADGSRPAGASSYLLQLDSDQYRLADGQATGRGQRAPGWFAVSGPSGGCAVAVRDFWQLFPKELEATPSGAVFHMWPAHGVADPNRKVEDAMLQYLWFAHEGKVLDLQVPESYYQHAEQYSAYDYRYVRSAEHANGMGLAKTHELMLSFAAAGADPAGAALNADFQDSPTALPAPQWLCDSGVFGKLQPVDAKQFAVDEALMSDTFDAERRMQDATRDYGMWNFGDGHTSWDPVRRRWNDVYRTWRNTHHGAPRVPWLLYLRSGDPKYLAYGIRNARHVADIDFCHYSTPEFEALEYPKGKLKGALNDYKGLVHWHSGNRLTDYNSMTDFLLWYWHLTGDRWGLEVAQDWGEAVKQRYGKPFGHREGAGTCAALLELYQETLDQRTFEIAEDLAKYLISTQKPDGSFPQWENYAPWLERYCALTGSAEGKAALVRWADAYYNGYGDSMSTYNVGGELSTLAHAWYYTKDARYLARGRWLTDKLTASVYRADDPLLKGFMQAGQTSLGGYALQRLPVLLRALADYGQPLKPDMLIAARPGFALLFERTRPELDGQPTKLETVEAWLLETKDAAFQITVHTTHSYEQRRYLGELLAPDGGSVRKLDEQVPRGSKDFVLAVPADGQTGIYKLRLGGVGSYGAFKDPVEVEPKLPVAFPLPGRLVTRDPAGYQFWVPRGVTRLALSLRVLDQSAVAGQITSPDGDRYPFAVGPSDQAATVVEVKPDADQTNAAWTLHLGGAVCQAAFVAEGATVPQLLFAEPYPAAVCEAMAEGM